MISMNNCSTKPCAELRNIPFHDHNYPGRRSILGALAILISLLTMSLSVFPGAELQSIAVNAAVDIDTSGDGRAAAFDGEEGIATDGDSFCSITDDIAGGKFSSLFEGIVGDCEDKSSLNPLLIEYTFTKNLVKLEEKSYFTVTVKD